MKRLLSGVVGLLFALSALAQSWRESPPLINNSGTTLPATCTVGQLFFKTNATAGQNIYECQSTNVWTQQLNSGGGVTPTGTGYTHITAGVQDAASKLVNLTAATDTAANQGTTTTVLHGNAAGQPSFGSVVLTTDVSGTLPIANGGTGTTAGVAGQVWAGATPAFTATPVLGAATVATGTLGLSGTTSGTVTIQPQAAAGTYNFNLPTTAGTAGQVLTSQGGGASAMTWSAAGGATALSGITAATAANTIASGNNTGQVWNWANTTDLTTAFTFGETSAATGGTGINQVLLKASTLAASTQTPFLVKARGAATSFIVDPTGLVGINATPSVSGGKLQINSTSGGVFSTSLAFRQGGSTTWGFDFLHDDNSSGNLQLNRVNAGAATQIMTVARDSTSFGFGTVLAPVGIINVSSNAADSIVTIGQHNAGTTSGQLNFRKSRGTNASPTVVTTGDDLATLNFAGFVGPTNAYVNAAAIKATSTGTIADTTTGIGGQLDFATSLDGTSTAPATLLRMDKNGHLNFLAGTHGAAPTVTAGCGTTPTITGNDSVFVLNVGTGGTATSCTVTFNKSFTNVPHCFVQDETSQAITTTAAPATGSVVLTATAAWTASSKLDVLCIGHL